MLSRDRATTLKAGGCGLRSHLSSLFSMKMEEKDLEFIPLFVIEV